MNLKPLIVPDISKAFNVKIEPNQSYGAIQSSFAHNSVNSQSSKTSKSSNKKADQLILVSKVMAEKAFEKLNSYFFD